MVSYFGTSLVLAGWVLSIYQLVFIGAIPVVSRLSDTLGRRLVFMLCLVCFLAGSFLCALAPTMGWLIFFRVIQGVGGGGFVSTATGIVSDEFPDRRQRSIGLISSALPFGAIVGPSIGAIMVESLGWRSVFWVNVPVSLIALVLAWRLVRADTKKPGHSDLDLVSVGLLTACVSAVMIALTLMDKAYHMSPAVIVLAALLGLGFLVAFVFRSRYSPGAVVSMEMLVRRPFMAANAYNFAYGACAQSGILSFLPLYASSVYGMSVFESGLMITPRSFGMMVFSIIASLSIMKWGYRRPIVIGSLTIGLGLIVLALAPAGMTLAGTSLTPVMMVMLVSLVLGIGAGVAAPSANNACVELMPDKVASITGLRQVSRQMGGAISIAVSTLVLESSGSVAQGFTLVFLGSGLMMLLSIPAAFFMPESPIPRTARSPEGARFGQTPAR